MIDDVQSNMPDNLRWLWSTYGYRQAYLPALRLIAQLIEEFESLTFESLLGSMVPSDLDSILDLKIQ